MRTRTAVKFIARSALLLMLVIVLIACEGRGQSLEDLPTRAPSVDAIGTAVALTENAPPPGFREPLAFPRIDANTGQLPNWRYEVTLAFDGVFTGTPRPVEATTTAQVWFNRIDTSRRVVIEASGVLAGQEADELIEREGVRKGPDTFLVQGNTCLPEADGAAAAVADLQAGDLIGGVARAVSVSEPAVIHGEDVWRYDFTPADLTLPGIDFTENGGVTAMSGELWIAPAHDAVIRWWVTMEVDGAILPVLAADAESAAPVSGQLIIRYDLYDIGIDPNIAVPFGC